MRMNYFGDSYDIVKYSLLKWLDGIGEWSAHPMFTRTVSKKQVAEFEAFLGVKVLSQKTLTDKSNRLKYMSIVEPSGNLFLDPDTGLRLKRCRARSSQYLFADELVALVASRPTALTMVFDQSLPRGKEKQFLMRKMKHLTERGVSSFAYLSHACFIVAGIDHGLIPRRPLR